MQLGMIGLGRMGGNIVRRLMKHGHATVVYDKDPKAVAAIAADGAVSSGALEDFGNKAVVDRLDPIFAALAPGIGDIPRTAGRDGRDPRIEQGYIHPGPVGAGHFVKMIHNGIEYGLMQAYAEGFDILKNANIDALPAEHRFDLDIADIAEARRRGSVIPSWLLDLTASALARNDTLDNYSGFVEDSGEGRWTVNADIDEAVPAEVLTAALFARFRSRKEHTFAEKILSAMRDGFGGHKEPQQHDAPDIVKPKASRS